MIIKSFADHLRLSVGNLTQIPDLFIDVLHQSNIEVSFLEISAKYSDCVSNSHGCPVDGITNWGGRIEGAPRNYPGWQGNFKCFAKTYKIFHTSFLTDVMHNVVRGFHFGGGCPGKINEYKADIGFYFFLDDFPKIKKNWEKHKALSSFSDNKIDKKFNEINFIKGTSYAYK